jgi:hypothetical protein
MSLYNLLGAASSVGGLVANLFKSKPVVGEHADWAEEVPTHFVNYGVQRDTLGMIWCPVPKVMKDRYGNANDKIYGVTRRTDSFNVPGTTIPTSEVRRYGVGPAIRVPIGTVNNNTITINLIADVHGLYYQWMMAWMDGIVNFNGRKTRAMLTPNQWGANFYEVAYFKDYAVDLTLLEMNEKFDTIIETTLVGAYPVAISDKQINWAGTGLMSFNLEFAYTAVDVKIDRVKPPGRLPPPPSRPWALPVGSIIKGLAMAQVLSSLKDAKGSAQIGGIVAAGAATLGLGGR